MTGCNTERLFLCPYTEADLDDLTDLWTNPLVQPLIFADEFVPWGLDFKDSLRTSMERAAFAAIIRLKRTGEFMGQVMVTVFGSEPRISEGVLGICLLPKFWDNGYGTEAARYMVDYAFRWFDLHKMSLSVWASNARAVAVYKKIGFKIEGRKRRSSLMHSRWEDELIMRMFYDDWAVRTLYFDS